MADIIGDKKINRFSFGQLQVILLTTTIRVIVCFPWPFLYYIGCFIGSILYWFCSEIRRVTKINLSACFPDFSSHKINRLIKAHFHAFGIGLMSACMAWYACPDRLQRLLKFRNGKMLETVIDEKNGVIIFAPHFIGLELLGMYVSASCSHKKISMNHKLKNKHLDKLLTQIRSARGGFHFFSHRKDNLIKMIKCIRDGSLFYYLPDQSPSKQSSEFVPFYGIKVATYSSLGRIAKLTNAPVVPCMLRVRKYGRGFELIVHDPLQDFPTGNDVEDTTIANKVIEKLIAYAPEQYLWCHRRFKKLPEGEKPFY